MKPMGARARRWWCGLTGHDWLLSFEDGLRLHCQSCGAQSDGWTLDARKPIQRYAGDPRRHKLRALRLRRKVS